MPKFCEIGHPYRAQHKPSSSCGRSHDCVLHDLRTVGLSSAEQAEDTLRKESKHRMSRDFIPVPQVLVH